MLCRACEELANDVAAAPKDGAKLFPDGFVHIHAIKAKVDSMQAAMGNPVPEEELLDMCETEGNDVNGGGSFDVRVDRGTGTIGIRFVPGHSMGSLAQRAVGPPGEIGSPIVGSGAFPSSHNNAGTVCPGR
jgi:hypothetical protein